MFFTFNHKGALNSRLQKRQPAVESARLPAVPSERHNASWWCVCQSWPVSATTWCASRTQRLRLHSLHASCF